MTNCPYCNASLPADPVPICPLCHERLTKAPAGRSEKNSVGAGQPLWFRVAFFMSCVLSVVILMVGWKWVERRPGPVPIASQANPPSPFGPATYAPMNVPAIGYLPGEATAIAAIQLNSMREYAKRSGISPDKLLNDLGLPQGFQDDLAKAGLPMDAIDHCAAALELASDDAIPALTMILVGREPIADSVVSKIGGMKSFVLPLSARRVGEKTLVIGTKPERLVASPKQEGAEHIRPALRRIIGAHLSPSSWAWAVGEADSWESFPTISAIAVAKPEWKTREYAKFFRAFAVGLSLEPELSVGVAIKCDSETNARKLRDHFGVRGASRPTLVGGEDNWATIDVPIKADELPEVVRRISATK